MHLSEPRGSKVAANSSRILSATTRRIPARFLPGMEKADLITVAHVVDGRVIGGLTWAVRDKE